MSTTAMMSRARGAMRSLRRALGRGDADAAPSLLHQTSRGLADAARGDAAAAAAAAADGGGPHAAARARPAQRRRWPLGVDGLPRRTASARRLGISTSPQKLNLVARLVRGLSVAEAQRQLVGTLKKHSVEVSQAIRTAVTNARSFGLVEERLVVSRAFVNKGKYLRRLRPWHGKGRFGIEHKKYAHLCVEVEELSDERWEAKVLPQYLHLKYRPDQDKPRRVAENLVKPWLVRSQLDLSLEETQRRTAKIRATLPKRKHPFPQDWTPDPSLL